MKINKITLCVALAMSLGASVWQASAAESHWWQQYGNQPGFKEGLSAIGYDYDQLEINSSQVIKDSGDSRTPLFWLKRSMEMYPPATPNHYNLPIVHHETRDWTNSLQATMGRGIFFFTRTAADAGQTVTISAGAIPAGATCYAVTGNGFKDTDTMFKNQVELAAGKTTQYTFSERGVLLVGCGDPVKAQRDVTVPLTVTGGKDNHLFILGQNVQDDWGNSKITASHFGFAYLFDGRANTLVPRKIVDVTPENINAVLGENLKVSALYEKLNGMDGSEEIFKSGLGSLFYNYDTCCYAAYRRGFTGIGFSSSRMNADDWGRWHEVGHLHEPMHEYVWGPFSEIQVNRYSSEACQLIRGKHYPLNKCHSGITEEEGNWDKDAVVKFLQSGPHYADYTKITNVFRKLAFFNFLRFSYGEDFFPKVNQARLRAIYAAPGADMAAKKQYVMHGNQKVYDFSVVAYSQAAGYDLRNYFLQWGMHFSEAAGQKVAEMHLPQPGEKSDETSNLAPELSVSRDNIVAVATFNHGFAYSVTAKSNRDDVIYNWSHISGDQRIYVRNSNAATAELVIPKEVKSVTARFQVTASNNHGTTARFVDITSVSPEVTITGPGSIARDKPQQLKAAANFREAAYQWILRKNNKVVEKGIDTSGQIKAGLAAGRYSAEVTATSHLGLRRAVSVHDFEVKPSELPAPAPAPQPQAPEWNAGTTYSAPCTPVLWKGSVWKNGWWTRGVTPGSDGQWGVWRMVGSSQMHGACK